MTQDQIKSLKKDDVIKVFCDCTIDNLVLKSKLECKILFITSSSPLNSHLYVEAPISEFMSIRFNIPSTDLYLNFEKV